ncbi:bifunctional diguanylate cyclase/phosphodiesterase [Bacillus sp. V5-8f]|uniref:putative bifunctional diguanylate cyclase/phosphodiesterase n=1 Tax=Bacillus sp. V5-8f TaxID=2053044 RepID=UPI000C773D7A|nr:EAL domain-containing protein [Bacillus sp. V5-8f]PLT33331.1 GGDEF-domain containing protein [Bacillus sp. V5-8f]
MVGMKSLFLQFNGKTFLFISILGLVLFCSSFKLTLVYGITFTFTSIFMFLMLRLFGLAHSIIAGMLAFLFVPHNFTSIFGHTIVLLEIIFVEAFFYRGRKAKMIFVDALFWLTIGLASIFYLNRTALSENALYFVMSKDFFNGLFNVLIADMLLAYFPFYKLLAKLNKNHVSIHQFLTHVTLISILIPFCLSVLTNTRNSHEFIHDIERQAKSNIIQIEQELLLWNADDLRKLSLYGSTQMDKLDKVVQQKKSRDFDIVISGFHNDVIVSTSNTISVKEKYDWQHTYDIKKVSNNVYRVLPKGQDDGLPIIKWEAGKYVYVKPVDPLSLNINIEFPIVKYQEYIYRDFLDKLGYSLVFALGTVLLILVVSRILMNNLKQLTVVTTGLPQKLFHLETVEWPQSNVAELRLLTRNLMKMADKLKELFQESHEMNEQLRDRTKKLKESEEQLHQLAFYDVLTGLPNRLHFQTYVKQLITNNATKHLAVIFIDLNQFKRINDTLGHDAGDTLLQLTASKLRSLQNSEREVFRLGGDEFVVVHCVEGQEEVSETLERILKEFSTCFSIQGQTLYITASIGISMYPEDGTDLDTLVKCADSAMYLSKEKGGNVPQFFDESMRDRFQERLLIENALRQAVEKGDFELFYQPKTRAGMVTSMEALMRWHDPVLGFVSPSTFIPIAEEIGLILQIDEWALMEACKQNKEWHDQGLAQIPVSANLSAKHFQQDYLVSMIKKTLDESGMDPKFLKLEITESVFIKDAKHVAEVIYKLKSLDVHISIDDFGKGYSSLYQLLHLPIDEIKIDRQFIEGIDQDVKKALLVSSVLDIAHGLDLNVVAEGVETEKERDLLVQMGCDELQGYLFSPPISKIKMAEFLCVDESLAMSSSTKIETAQ